ncbi:MAG: SDR family NAD(P)-dependent oxidoreductase [Acidimicrobiales bacterium]|nr:SDR family NAD(P)-dependent oxidoreductase [Acidimicrobiales bacterium]
MTGAGSGIGLHLATILAAEGSSIAAFDLDLAGTARAAMADAGGRPGQRCTFHQVDVGDAAAIAAAFEEAAALVGRPHLLVNSAGISRNDVFSASTTDDFEQTVHVNLVGSRNVAHGALPLMQRGDRLALISSLAGLLGGYSYAAYAASKAGVIGLAKVLRLEYAPLGIGVSVICPPEIMTPMVERYAATMHPATRALKDVAGTLPIDQACRSMLHGLERGRFMVVPGSRARRTYWLNRLAPDRVTQAITDRIVRNALATHPEADPFAPPRSFDER